MSLLIDCILLSLDECQISIRRKQSWCVTSSLSFHLASTCDGQGDHHYGSLDESPTIHRSSLCHAVAEFREVFTASGSLISV